MSFSKSDIYKETISELAKLFGTANSIGVFSMRQAKEITKSFESFWNMGKNLQAAQWKCALSLWNLTLAP